MRLSDIAYYQTGGEAAGVFEPTSIDEAREALARCREGEGFFVLGAGSNSLVGDGRWSGMVLSCRKLDSLERRGRTLVIGAGVSNDRLSEFAYDEGLSGLEWMKGLPGQVGGTVRMNARCYGGEIGSFVRSVSVGSPGSREVVRLQNEGKYLFRGYKDTRFMASREVILEVEIDLTDFESSDQRASARRRMDGCLQDRQGKGQFDYPSCGCVFKNDYSVGVPSGRLLETAGVRDLRSQQGRASVGLRHANFVFNTGGASAEEILLLTLAMRERVYEVWGVWLAYEMELLGHFSEELRRAVNETRPARYRPGMF